MSKFIYVMQSGKDKYKVGISVNPLSRLTSVQTGSSDKVSVIFTYWSDEPFYYEKLFHQKFADYQIIGEWFKFDHKGFIKEMLDVLLGDCDKTTVTTQTRLPSMNDYIVNYLDGKEIVVVRDIPRPNNESDCAVAAELKLMGCVQRKTNHQRFYITPKGIQKGVNTYQPKQLVELYKSQGERV